MRFALQAIALQAIYHAETIETRKEWDEFTAELAKTRTAVWCQRPWPRAKSNDGFLDHVRNLAETFANSRPSEGDGVRYEGRKTNPLAATA